jgi:phage terminase large subunit-like protein
MDFPTAVKAFEAFAAKHADIHEHLVEDKANGPAVIATLKHKISGIIALSRIREQARAPRFRLPRLRSG